MNTDKLENFTPTVAVVCRYRRLDVIVGYKRVDVGPRNPPESSLNMHEPPAVNSLLS